MRTLLPASFCLLLLLMPATASGAEVDEVAVSELVADPATWDGRRLAVTGELVGDYSLRAEGVWVQVNDDAYATSPIGGGGVPVGTNIGLGARIPPALFAGNVDGPPGRHGRIGPLVRLEGVFVHSDPELGGETYLAVDRVETLVPARSYPIPGADPWLGVGLALMIVSGTITWRQRRRFGPVDAGVTSRTRPGRRDE